LRSTRAILPSRLPRHLACLCAETLIGKKAVTEPMASIAEKSKITSNRRLQ
jgi:hypothetical protein